MAVALRRHWRSVVVLLVVLAVVAVPVGRWLLGGEDPGSVVPVRTGVQGSEATVVVPTGKLEFTVGDPVEAVPAEAALDGEAHAAARGTRFVPVELEVLTAQLEPGPGDAFDTGATPDLDARLVSGGTRVPLDVRDDRTAYVAVAGDGKDVHVEVRFDGVTQRANVRTGAVAKDLAGPLYADTTAANRVICPARHGRSPGFTYDFACAGGPLLVTPWARGLGWAARGRTWAVATIYTTMADLRWTRSGGGPVARYDVTAGKRRVTVDGLDPTQIVPGPFDTGPTARQDVVAFEVPRAISPRFDVIQEFTGRAQAGPSSRGAPPRPRVVVRTTTRAARP